MHCIKQLEVFMSLQAAQSVIIYHLAACLTPLSFLVFFLFVNYLFLAFYMHVLSLNIPLSTNLLFQNSLK